MLNALVPVIRDGILRESPTHSGSSNVFSGSFDWHSAVHAYWALLSMARELGDRGLEAFVLGRLSTSALDETRRMLNQPSRASFELPYGQAWLTLLLSELVLRPSAITPELSTLRRETEARVLNWLVERPIPSGGSDIGTHGSWLCAFWLLQLSNPSNEVKRTLDRLRRERIDPARSKIEAYRPTGSDFLYPPAILALIDSSPPNVSAAPYPPGREGEVPSTARDVHAPGLALSRVWPYAARAAVGDEEARVITERRLDVVMSNPALWRDDFAAVSHWVPQFAWMNLFLLAGRHRNRPSIG